MRSIGPGGPSCGTIWERHIRRGVGKDSQVKKATKVLVATGAAVALLAGSAATAYGTHFQDRSAPGATVAGVAIGNQTRAEAERTLTDAAARVRLTVTTPAGSRELTLAQAGYTVDVAATVDQLFARTSSITAYAKALVSAPALPAVVKTDQAAVDAFVAELVSTEGETALNASVQLPEGGESFTVTPAQTGTTVDPATFQEVARRAAASLRSARAQVQFIELDPAVSTAAAQAVADRANALVATPVTISVAGRTFTAEAADKAAWIQVPVTDGVPGDPTPDPARIADWVNAQAGLAAVEPVKGVRNVNSAGAVLSVTKEAKDGRTVTNADAVAQELAGALAGAAPYAGEFTTKVVPATWTERRIADGAQNLAYPAAEGEKWIDVNLSRKTMTAYEGARPVIGPLAMVDGAGSTPTVTGTYKIYLKFASQTMRGPNADGTRYEQPDVPWVMYFHRGYALHGAYWRSSFGYSGSHGCVNLPVGSAKTLYDWAPMGTPVVSHY